MAAPAPLRKVRRESDFEQAIKVYVFHQDKPEVWNQNLFEPIPHCK